MKIALVAPYSLFRSEYPLSENPRIDSFLKPRTQFAKSGTPSDSLLELAALTPRDHELVYMDDQFNNIDTSQDADLAAITTITMSADRAYEIAKEFRKRGVYVVMGGIHATLASDDASKHADTVFAGDANGKWAEFLDDFKKGKAKKFYYSPRTKIDKLPPPLINLLPGNRYYREVFKKEVYSLRTSVGCTRMCKYCSNWQKRGCNRHHKKTLKQIRRELEQISSYSDNYLLTLIDDNPFLDVKYIAQVLEYIKELNVRWLGTADVSIAGHPKLLDIIRESGCALLSLGLESLDPDNLKWLAPWKARQVKSYEKGLRIMRDHGLNLYGSFMIGMDNDDASTYEKCFDFFLKSNLSAAAVTILTPAPGTPFRRRLIDENRLDISAPWSAYTGSNLLYKHPKLTKQQAYDGFYWFLKQMESPEVADHIKKVTFK